MNGLGAQGGAGRSWWAGHTRLAVWAACHAAWVAIAACGAAPAPRTASHDDVRSIQRDEAMLEESATAAHDPAMPCARVCEARAQMDGASARICALASQRDDGDLLTRCDQAQRRTDAAALARNGECPCRSRP